jgi:hypothetical protein|tara:strand:- start:1382 stop:1585 length:204 start_codon:yes stop_codon:yes gene_type:complete
MERFQTVQENDSFQKDTVTGAILNSDSSALVSYKARKKAAMALSAELEQVKQDVSEMKEMLMQLLNK